MLPHFWHKCITDLAWNVNAMFLKECSQYIVHVWWDTCHFIADSKMVHLTAHQQFARRPAVLAKAATLQLSCKIQF